jgi:acyl dehydratase
MRKQPARLPEGLAVVPTAESTAWPYGVPVVGATASRSREVTADDIARFTAISGDRHPLHYDAELAAGTRLGGLVVQGGVITAILNAVVAEHLPGPGSVFLQTNWSFRAPVRPGDTITGHAQVLEVRRDKPITRLATKVVRGDGVVSVEGEALCYTFAVPPAARSAPGRVARRSAPPTPPRLPLTAGPRPV